jgi:hypothetical protein
MAITQLLGFATQVLGLALLACQHYTDFWPTSWLYKEQERERERERTHIHSAGIQPSLQWVLYLSQIHSVIVP